MDKHGKFLLRMVRVAGLSFLVVAGGLQAQVQSQDPGSEVVFGHQLMTQQEIAEHRAKMRSLDSAQAREAYRLEHHKKMLERARERGVTLPEMPMGPGGGMGMGPNNPPGPGGRYR